MAPKIMSIMVERGGSKHEFFHRVANSHRRTNTIEMLNIDGAVCTEAPVIQEHIVSVFEHLLTEQVG